MRRYRDPLTIRSKHGEFLSLDEIKSVAPSAFATQPYHAMSSNYQFIPTSAIIEAMGIAGLHPVLATQSRTRVEGKREFTKHMIRFRMSNLDLQVGDIFPESVLVNGHDGSSAYVLMGGIFRLTCLNGAVISEASMPAIHVRHSGSIIDEVASGTVSIVANMPKTIDAISRWRTLQLKSAEQQAFAEMAHTIRFGDTPTPILPLQLLRSQRWQDAGNDLWSVFNRVQENAIKGGLAARNADTRRLVRTRTIQGIDQDVRVNRELWTLTETMAQMVTSNN